MTKEPKLEGEGWLYSVLVLAGGVPVCTGIVVVALGSIGHILLSGDPLLPRSDLGIMAFWGVAGMLVVGLGLRAWWRNRRGLTKSVLPWLTRAVPFLVAVGAVGGVLFFRSILAERERSRAESERSMCRDTLDKWARTRSPDPGAVERCLPDARRCMAQAAREEVKASGSRMILDFEFRPEVKCLKQAGEQAGWLK